MKTTLAKMINTVSESFTKMAGRVVIRSTVVKHPFYTKQQFWVWEIESRGDGPLTFIIKFDPVDRLADEFGLVEITFEDAVTQSLSLLEDAAENNPEGQLGFHFTVEDKRVTASYATLEVRHAAGF